ncbi:MAG: hypothetical protein ACI9XK_001230 [Granulosicoccus sp.]
MSDDELQYAADAICEQFQKPDNFYATYRLELSLPMGLDDYSMMPMDTKVISTSPSTLNLFINSDSSDRVWGDLVSTNASAGWLEEFNTTFAICAERKYSNRARKPSVHHVAVKLYVPQYSK